MALTNPIFVSSSNLKADLRSELSVKENSHIFPNDVYSVLYMALLYLIKTSRCYQLIMFPLLLRDISSVEIHSFLSCLSIRICLQCFCELKCICLVSGITHMNIAVSIPM